MSILKKAAELFSPSDPELVDKTLARLAEQDTWNDVFSTKLIDLLDNIDRLKSEIRQSSRVIDQRGADAKKSADESVSRLNHACQIEEKATVALREARQHLLLSETNLQAACKRNEAAESSLAKALEFASEARARDARVLLRLRKAVLWAVVAIAFSLVALVWGAWFVFRATMPLWIACIVTVIIMLATTLVSKRSSNES